MENQTDYETKHPKSIEQKIGTDPITAFEMAEYLTDYMVNNDDHYKAITKQKNTEYSISSKQIKDYIKRLVTQSGGNLTFEDFYDSDSKLPRNKKPYIFKPQTQKYFIVLFLSGYFYKTDYAKNYSNRMLVDKLILHFIDKLYATNEKQAIFNSPHIPDSKLEISLHENFCNSLGNLLSEIRDSPNITRMMLLKYSSLIIDNLVRSITERKNAFGTITLLLESAETSEEHDIYRFKNINTTHLLTDYIIELLYKSVDNNYVISSSNSKVQNDTTLNIDDLVSEREKAIKYLASTLFEVSIEDQQLVADYIDDINTSTEFNLFKNVIIEIITRYSEMGIKLPIEIPKALLLYKLIFATEHVHDLKGLEDLKSLLYSDIKDFVDAKKEQKKTEEEFLASL